MNEEVNVELRLDPIFVGHWTTGDPIKISLTRILHIIYFTQNSHEAVISNNNIQPVSDTLPPEMKVHPCTFAPLLRKHVLKKHAVRTICPLWCHKRQWSLCCQREREQCGCCFCPRPNMSKVLAVGWKHRAKYAVGWESTEFFFSFLDSVRLLLLSPQQKKISLWNLFKAGTFNIKEQRVGETKSGGGGVTSGITGIQFRPKMSPSGSTFSFQITETSTWKKASASHLMSWGKKKKKK